MWTGERKNALKRGRLKDERNETDWTDETGGRTDGWGRIDHVRAGVRTDGNERAVG